MKFDIDTMDMLLAPGGRIARTSQGYDRRIFRSRQTNQNAVCV
jgi:hypothetical protein